MAKSGKKKWKPPSNCKELIKQCQIYISKERGDVAYRCAIRLARDGEVLDAVLLLLTSWNAIYYTRGKGRFFYSKELTTRVRNLLDNTKGQLRKLGHKNLEELTSKDFERIESIFGQCSNEEAVKNTGASKLLHVLKPQLFVMWDTDIRNNYHRYFHKQNRKKSNHECGNPKCYSMFLKQMQECALKLIKEKPKKKICEECSSHPFTIDLPKALDQYNYAKAKLSAK